MKRLISRLIATTLLGVFFNMSPVMAEKVSVPVEAQTIDENFTSWKKSFKIEALAAGITSETYDREMATVAPLKTVLKANNNQPEFTRSVWDYLDGAVSTPRVTNGRSKQAANTARLDKIETAYGVDKEIIVAIWGLESSYGAITGNHDALSALATLAHKGRRVKYGSTQLISALKIIQEGYATRSQLKGSWAGAMGQTQFIPTTYLDYAIDENGDGKRDLWGNLDDVFASTAHYLKRSGYKHNAPWGVEIILPAGFDYTTADKSNRKLVVEWMSAGIKKAGAGTLFDGSVDINAMGYIILPAGANGPAFMVFDNFKAILKYNNSTSYALGIGMLSNEIAGRTKSLAQDWPRADRALSLSERKSLQQALTDKGYAPGPVDGIVGAGTRKALRQWQKDNNLPADGYASATMLQKLLSS